MKEFEISESGVITIVKGENEYIQKCPYNVHNKDCTLECPKAMLRDWKTTKMVGDTFANMGYQGEIIGEVLTLCGESYYNEK